MARCAASLALALTVIDIQNARIRRIQDLVDEAAYYGERVDSGRLGRILQWNPLSKTQEAP